MKRAKTLAASPLHITANLDHTSVLDRALFSEQAVYFYGVQQNTPVFCDTSGSTLVVNAGSSIGIDGTYNMYFDITWTPILGATSYTVSLITLHPDEVYTVEYTGDTSARVFLNWIDSGIYEYPVTVKANDICRTSGVSTLNHCFLEGAIVQMADGSQKTIETVVVGDRLLGAFGEVNPVLALHRPLLGSAHMNRINGEHSTTAHHPHVSIDRKFYCSEPSVVETTTYGHEHDVMDGSGNTVKRMLHGLKKGRVQQLTVGVVLKTVEGSRPVVSLETYDLPPETQLYNLVMGGSHTYHVDGYAVTGWPSEEDWNYDTWTSMHSA
jgi:hypothetical protein